MGRSIGKIDKGIPMPIMPTENVGIMSGAIRKKSGGRRDKRGSRRGGSMTQVPKSQIWDNVIMPESQWFTVDDTQARGAMKYAYDN